MSEKTATELALARGSVPWGAGLKHSIGLSVDSRRITAIENDVVVFRAGSGLSPAERAGLAAEADDLESTWLRKARGDDLRVIAKLMALPASDQGEATDLEMAVYLEVMTGLPVGPLELAVGAILRGTAPPVDGKPVSKRFRPTPAEIAAVTRQLAAPAYQRLGQIRRWLQGREERPIPNGPREIPPELKAKIARFVGRAKLDDPAGKQDFEGDRRNALSIGLEALEAMAKKPAAAVGKPAPTDGSKEERAVALLNELHK
jgi:hypothetical protein